MSDDLFDVFEQVESTPAASKSQASKKNQPKQWEIWLKKI